MSRMRGRTVDTHPVEIWPTSGCCCRPRFSVLGGQRVVSCALALSGCSSAPKAVKKPVVVPTTTALAKPRPAASDGPAAQSRVLLDANARDLFTDLRDGNLS